MASSVSDSRLEDQADRLYGLYERKAKAFRAALISVMSLITVILALVFYPYVTFRGERYELEALQEKNGAAFTQAKWVLTETAKQIDDYRQSMQRDGQRIHDLGLDALQDAAEGHAQILADIKSKFAGDAVFEEWLAKVTDGKEPPPEIRRRHPALRQGRRDPCFWRMGDAWLRCTLKETLSEVDIAVVKQFERSRVTELRRDLFGDLADAVGKLKNSFATYLLSNETSWRLDAAAIATSMSDRHPIHLRVNSNDWRKQLEIPGPLKAQTRRYVDFYLQLLEAHERYLIETRNRLREDVRDLGKEEARIQDALKVIIAKLEGLKGLQNIETPFGTLPVGLNELVLLFPILVASGFMLMTSLFVESLVLRREYHLLTRLVDPQSEVLPDRRVALMAPLWIDPLTPVAYRIYRGIILCLPVLVFVFTIGLLAWNSLLMGPFIEEARLNEVIYIGLYIAGAVAILEGSRRTVQALRRYAVSRH